VARLGGVGNDGTLVLLDNFTQPRPLLLRNCFVQIYGRSTEEASGGQFLLHPTEDVNVVVIALRTGKVKGTPGGAVLLPVGCEKGREERSRTTSVAKYFIWNANKWPLHGSCLSPQMSVLKSPGALRNMGQCLGIQQFFILPC